MELWPLTFFSKLHPILSNIYGECALYIVFCRKILNAFKKTNVIKSIYMLQLYTQMMQNITQLC